MEADISKVRLLTYEILWHNYSMHAAGSGRIRKLHARSTALLPRMLSHKQCGLKLPRRYKITFRIGITGLTLGFFLGAKKEGAVVDDIYTTPHRR